MTLKDDAEYDDVFSLDLRREDYLQNLFSDRSFPSWFTRAVVDIPVGDEILDNYLTYGGKRYWKDNLRELKSLCTGQLDFTVVGKYEQAKLQQQKMM